MNPTRADWDVSIPPGWKPATSATTSRGGAGENSVNSQSFGRWYTPHHTSVWAWFRASALPRTILSFTRSLLRPMHARHSVRWLAIAGSMANITIDFCARSLECWESIPPLRGRPRNDGRGHKDRILPQSGVSHVAQGAVRTALAGRNVLFYDQAVARFVPARRELASTTP